MLKSLLFFLGRVLVRAATDKALSAIIKKAVLSAEHTGKSGKDKMDMVLTEVKKSGAKALLEETESTLRTKIEQTIDDLGV